MIMISISELNNPEFSQHTLVLGFAFSLTPEGLPGSYNDRIAEQLKEIISIARNHETSSRSWIGMQWEIFDAIESTWGGQEKELLDLVPLSHIGAPPLFTKD